LALLALLAAPAGGRAGEGPALLPAHDVDITYDIPDGARTLQQRMRWDVADRLLRVDPPDAGIYMIVDYAADRMQMVHNADRSVLQMPASRLQLPGAGAGGFTRAGQASVAGLDCTEWLTRDNSGQDSRICVTGDGVLLRASAGERVLLQARQVTFAAQPAAVFRPPSDYRLTERPAEP
jgi:hypothetical protein